jgi:hypothetical protein
MKHAYIKNDGGITMMARTARWTKSVAGSVFTISMAEWQNSNESDLMAGLAAYTMLNLAKRTHGCREIGHEDPDPRRNYGPS